MAIHSNLVTDDVDKFLAKENLDMPFALDKTGAVIKSLGGSTQLPMTVIVDADGKPIMFGDILYGEDGRAWTVLGPYTKRWLFVSGVNLDGEPVKQPVMAKWMTRVPRKAEEK